jgi:hypothetical protein
MPGRQPDLAGCCAMYLENVIVGVQVKDVEVDEIWSRVYW